MFRKMLLSLIYFGLGFFLIFRYQFKINVYGSINFDKQTNLNQTMKSGDLLLFLKKILFSRAVEKVCFFFKTPSEIDIFLFEKLPYINLINKEKCILIDKNGSIIKEEIDLSKICVFLEEKEVILKDIKQHLTKKIMKNADALIISYPKYELFFNGSSLIYYDPNQINIFCDKLSIKTLLNKSFLAEFYPNDRFSLVFFKKNIEKL